MNSLSVAQRPSVDNSGYNPGVDHPGVDRTANAAHQVVETLADQALTGVGKVSDSLHVVVNEAADAVTNAAGWAAQVPARVHQHRIKLSRAASTTISARPLVTLGSAIALGFIIGRLSGR
jgi:hypothetical protein